MSIITMSQSKPPQEQIDYILNLFKSNQIQQALDFIDMRQTNRLLFCLDTHIVINMNY